MSFSFYNKRVETEKTVMLFKYIFVELLAKITFLQEASKMEIAKLLWYNE